MLDENLKNYIFKKSILEDNRIELNELQIIRKISEGTCSVVYLVQKKNTKINFALKCISKGVINQNNLLEKLITEKSIHSRLSFPFISHLVRTFKNPNFLLFLYEYIPGKTLFSTLEEFTTLSLKQVNFYSSIILLTLRYLHSKNIVHREIIPENFVIDELGYPILTHFTSSKILNGRTYSLAGVPHYIAPEIIKGDGHNFYSDIWSLGIIIYKFLYGLMPFGDGEEDPYAIYKSILEKPLQYPVFIKQSMKMNGLIDQLLEKVPALRGNAESVMTHS